MERAPSPDHRPPSAQQWVQYANPPPPSKFEEFIQNPVAVLAVGIVVGALIVSMRPIVVQAVTK